MTAERYSAPTRDEIGTLYVVGTPIGNLEDISLRALRVLREADVVAAEDTRSAKTLLQHYEITTPITSYHDFSGPAKTRRLVARIEQGESVALISEAGMPGVSDPGFPLIRDVLSAGGHVTCVPGPSAVLTALVLSGLPMHAFHYVGFLPRKGGERQRLLARLAAEPDTIVCFESPHRVVAALQDLTATFGPDRPLAVGRELTKKFEEVLRGSAADVLAALESSNIRGEFTLVIGGTGRKAPADSGAVPDTEKAHQRAPRRSRRGASVDEEGL